MREQLGGPWKSALAEPLQSSRHSLRLVLAISIRISGKLIEIRGLGDGRLDLIVTCKKISGHRGSYGCT